ncbi:flagellar protein FlbD [Caloranaerobacter azorensis DSM 13643]|uniref:Flagellar protein FlbD n=1 Tax=Caloranaerobacter azorensis DSM 13643 TaxID=1121264 RepID=A0A1M5RLQ0_9FIRM|nr:flagellar FlbD family protein [Caloranaerobacter azorensis]SHH27267.1 flagellar protein FlbD [Caloranaerobacter azorensis DSM 13643]
MIILKRINGKEFVLNSDLIEFVEATPDTIVTLTDGKKIVVKETVEEVINKVINYKREIYKSLLNIGNEV